jgi:riboflavin kinase/FMN adenylyltransferase
MDMQPVTLSGIVTRYKGNGRKLGYPTANLDIGTSLNDGVYFGFANLGELKDKPSLIFVGVPTTVGDTGRRVEAYLLDIPDKDYYGQELKVTIGHFHRPNKTFDNLEQLMEAIRHDEAVARQWFTQKPAAG